MADDRFQKYSIKKVYDKTFNRNVSSDILYSKTPKNEGSKLKSANDQNDINSSFIKRNVNKSVMNNQTYQQTNAKNEDNSNNTENDKFNKYAIKKVFDQSFRKNVSDIFFSKTPKNEKSYARSVSNLNDNNPSFIERNVINFSKRNI